MTVRVRSIAAVLGVLALCGLGLSAQSGSAEHASHAAHGAAADESAHYLTVNVGISDEAIEPSAVFIPAGRPVQLLLRNRGTTEHHYHVVGLVPDEVWWMTEGDGGEDGHNHHDRMFVAWRAPSPAGIRPTGSEVHAYVSSVRGLDVVLFTATRTGTFVVQCDLHPEQVATLTVFDPVPQAAASGSARGRQALARALTRDLGAVDYPGASGVRVEATYAPAEYVGQILGGLAVDGPAKASDGPAKAGRYVLEPDRHVAVLLTERVHTANLPGEAVPADLHVNGSPVPLVDRRVVTDSPHHRATVYRFARDDAFGAGHQVMTLRLASGQEATWHLPVLMPGMEESAGGPIGFADRWALIFAVLGGMLAAMWPCLFQLTVYFIPALAGVAMQGAGSPGTGRRRPILTAAFFFILGFTLVYTATGAVIGYAAERLGDTAQFEAWQRYIGVAAGIVVIGLALRVAAKVRAPLVCRMPVLSRMAHGQKPASRLEMMVAGLAFATGCMTCFGSALVVGMVVYIGLAQSALYGALVLFLFSLGMGVPLVIAAVAMARALPLLMKLERAVPYMGLASAVLMAGFGVLLISGHYMAVAEWTYRLIPTS
ncbi:MAG: sulfite exporter TauE/SafE family protein [Acidobacteria bacterium]|nr:sulfite exporter TauE/SafE family protein [Acidobacteriota bacterium]